MRFSGLLVGTLIAHAMLHSIGPSQLTAQQLSCPLLPGRSSPLLPWPQEADAMLHFLATGAGGEELEVRG